MKRKKPARGTDTRRLNLQKLRRRQEDEEVEPTRKKSVGIGLLNLGGMTTQGMEDVKRMVQLKDLDVLCLVETHVRKEDKEGVEVPGFQSHECRREGNEKKGGGLAILTRSGDMVFSRLQPSVKSIEYEYVTRERMWVTYSSKHGKTAVCCIYLACSNKDKSHVAWNRGILEVVGEEVFKLRGKGYRIVLQGDMNAWVGDDLSQGGIPGNRRKTTGNGIAFKDFLKANNLVHLNGACRTPGDWSTRLSVGLWTRHAPDNSSTSVLDYAVISREHLDTVIEMVVDEHGVMGGDSDHNLVTSRIEDKVITKSNVKTSSKEGWNLGEDLDWGRFKEVVRAELEAVDLITERWASVESLSNNVARVLTKGLEEGVGRKSFTPKDGTKILPGYILKLMRESRRVGEAWKREKVRFANSLLSVPPDSLAAAAQKVDDKKKEVNEAIMKFKRSVRAPIKKLCKMKSRRGMKMFWRFVSRIPHKRCEISSLQNKSTGVLHCEPEEVIEEVSAYLKQIFSGSDRREPSKSDVSEEKVLKDRENVGLDHSYHQVLPEGAVMPDHEYASSARPILSSSGSSKSVENDPAGFLDRNFSSTEVADMIKSLGDGKASGHDGIPNEALKNAPVELLRLLVLLFDKVKNQGKAPDSWKEGRLVLIHKKGALTDVFNYRPLTVLQSVSALYTKLLNKRLCEVTEAHKLLGEIQNGFRKGRSGGDSAFILNTVLWKTSAQQKAVHLAFLDLLKAYDTVDRPTLWKKLAKMGIGGKFLRSIQSLYDGDYVKCEVGGLSTGPVYLGRGLRQGCSLSPLLFALYLAGLGQDLSVQTHGVKLFRVCVSALFFADDIVLIARTAEGLRLLLRIVQHHCTDLKMSLSVTKCKVMSKSKDSFEVWQGDEVCGSLDKVLRFRYLGLECELTPAKTATAMKNRAIKIARSYKMACMRIARDGPDIVDTAVALWTGVARPSLLFGCEIVPFTEVAIQEIERQQSSLGKSALGLPRTAPNLSTELLLGMKSVKHVLYASQLKFYLRVQKQQSSRWSKDALLDHLRGSWHSPYIKYIHEVKKEVGMFRGPVSSRHVDLVLNFHFLRGLNEKASNTNLPALMRVPELCVANHVDESIESQVSALCMGVMND